MEDNIIWRSLHGEMHDDKCNLIRDYFFAGYTYDEMIIILHCCHGIKISIRQLHRELRSLGLRRHSTTERRQRAFQAVELELQGSGSTFGYRSMTRRLASAHGLVVSRHTVSSILQTLDPEAVARRRNRVIDRRTYINKGPNFLVHIDGYDKLKRYGFPIHGAIDGYSRRILWLHVAVSNNNPSIVATFFLKYLCDINVPRCVRMDGGTENILVEDIQKAFRWEHTDDMAAEKSVIIGSSHSNQRIERWWRSGRQGGCQSWIDLFASMESEGIFSTGDPLHVECMRFCFMDLLQQDLDKIRIDWNQHTIRESSDVTSPGGKPDLLYHLPNLFGAIDYKVDVNPTDVQKVVADYAVQKWQGCDIQFECQFNRIMLEKRLTKPTNINEALSLFGQLVVLDITVNG
ncbi:uncharacterized protein LOC123556376 isoform X2 [Mercenaria mercenaria]|uniref:uncharacterized protein LOC123556376 isoform X2 n=1 Tax=Mercenaria mercenaria TaxID=6596 RepID=UPI00234F9756|nr:uncharacterized protein LOC123556376 isoform X2 [Mercenaria mercenaria]